MKDLEQIRIPQNIDEIISSSIERGKNYKKGRARENRYVIAASLAICLIMCLTSYPTMAKGINFIKNVFGYLNVTSQSNKDFLYKGDDFKNAEDINTSAKANGINMTINQVACDGSNLIISFIVKSEKPFPQVKNIDVLPTDESIQVDFTSNSLSDDGLIGMCGKFVDDHTFVGMYTKDLFPLQSKGIAIPDKFQVYITINSISPFSGSNPPRFADEISGPWKFKIDVNKSTADSKVIEPNLTDNGAKINRITLTPMSTDIDVTIPKSYPEGTIIIAHDNNGTKLTPNKIEDVNSSGNMIRRVNKYSAIDKGAKAIIIKIVDKNTEPLKTLSQFEVQIK